MVASSPPEISFVVPAHNEEALVGKCVETIQGAMRLVAIPYEIIVVDDSSTDNTAAIARELGTRVLRVEHRQIAATRNAGGRAALGEVLFFVDADTFINERIVKGALKVLGMGKSGGGCVPRFDGQLPLWFKLVYPVFELAMRIFGQPGGSCLFCTPEAFRAIEGFSEAHYATEDAVFVTALKRHGGFKVLPGVVVTSGRKLRSFSFWTFLKLVFRLTLCGPDGFRKREGLDMWYGVRK